jgi:hypothetical protein
MRSPTCAEVFQLAKRWRKVFLRFNTHYVALSLGTKLVKTIKRCSPFPLCDGRNKKIQKRLNDP